MNTTAMRLPNSLLPTALLAAVLTTAAFAQESTTDETSLQDRLARWELDATVGVPDAEALVKMQAICDQHAEPYGSMEIMDSVTTISATDPVCQSCGQPRSNHPYRHPFIAMEKSQ